MILGGGGSTGFHVPESQYLVMISTDDGYNWNDITANIPGEMRWICKVLALAHFLDRFKNSYKQDQVLPPCIEKWPESRLEAVVRKAEHWLHHCAQFPGKVPAAATGTDPGAPPTQARP